MRGSVMQGMTWREREDPPHLTPVEVSCTYMSQMTASERDALTCAGCGLWMLPMGTKGPTRAENGSITKSSVLFLCVRCSVSYLIPQREEPFDDA